MFSSKHVNPSACIGLTQQENCSNPTRESRRHICIYDTHAKYCNHTTFNCTLIQFAVPTHPCLHPLLPPSMISMQVTGKIRANRLCFHSESTLKHTTTLTGRWASDPYQMPPGKDCTDEYSTKWRRVWKVQLWDSSHRFSVSLAVNFWKRFLPYSDVPVAVIISVIITVYLQPTRNVHLEMV